MDYYRLVRLVKRAVGTLAYIIARKVRVFVLPLEIMYDSEYDKMFHFGRVFSQTMLTCGVNIFAFQFVNSTEYDPFTLNEIFAVRMGDETKRMVIGFDFNFANISNIVYVT